MELKMRVLTLNCWGIPQPYPIGSKDRRDRICAIAERMNKEMFDIVGLEEIWSEKDYNYIKEAVQSFLPFSFYFHSGWLGSGVCIFSKYPIENTLIHRYSLNGYPHHFHRGDWFGGKVVGMVRLAVLPEESSEKFLDRPFYIHVYATHVHAEYDKGNDIYLAHRLTQAWELSQFVRATSVDADFVLVMGDMNLVPEDLGLKMILLRGRLNDAWITRESKFVPEEFSAIQGSTSDTPNNIYTSATKKKLMPLGQRIDYILYAENYHRNVKVDVKKCHQLMGRIEGTEINYSDHEAVFAEFNIQVGKENDKKSVAFDAEKKLIASERQILVDADIVLKRSLKVVSYNKKFFMGVLVVLFLLFIGTIDLELHFSSLALFIIIIRFLVTLGLGFSFWHGVIILGMEEKALKAARCGIDIALRLHKL